MMLVSLGHILFLLEFDMNTTADMPALPLVPNAPWLLRPEKFYGHPVVLI